MKKTVKCAVIGVGYLGKFHASKFAELTSTELVGVCDIDQARSKEIAAKYDIDSFTDYHDLIGKVDAVSIAATTSIHYALAKFFLEHDIHVLLEKPIATTLNEANELIAIAHKKKIIFQIGHLERFNPVFIALQSKLNHPAFIEATRVAPFKPRGTDVNVILDLMINDIELALNIIKAPVTKIFAYGAPVLSNEIDLARANIEFANGCVANLSASRVSLKSQHKMKIFQPDACLACDFNDKTLATFQKGTGKIKPYLPEILSEKITLENSDALQSEIVAFIESITKKLPPKVTAEEARDALVIALEITRIANEHLSNFNTLKSAKE